MKAQKQNALSERHSSREPLRRKSLTLLLLNVVFSSITEAP